VDSIKYYEADSEDALLWLGEWRLVATQCNLQRGKRYVVDFDFSSKENGFLRQVKLSEEHFILPNG
jgi:hypothetical protein